VVPKAEESQAETTVPSQPSTPVAVAEALLAKPKVEARKVPRGGLKSQGVKLAVPTSLATPERAKTEEEIAAEWAELNEAVTSEGVVRAWKAFADEREAAEQFNLAATLKTREPVLEGLRVTFSVVNHVQQEQLTEVSMALLSYLRRTLQNGKLELQVLLEEVEEQVQAKFLTDKERYDLMATRHPLLEVLRERLDLDLG
jgi:hypothetical protein